jgi:hypothetical protein
VIKTKDSKMQQLTRFLMITVLVVISVFLTWFFSDKQFWFSSRFKSPDVNGPVKMTESHVSSKSVTAKDNVTPAYTHNIHDIFNLNCRKDNLGVIRYEQIEGVYTWIDERGIKNYSDQKPNSNAELYRTSNSNALDFFELNLHAPGLSSEFKNKLSSNLRAVFRAYTSLIGLNAMRKVKLNLHILPNRRAYNRMVKSVGGNPQGTSGVYFGSKNTAYIEYSTFERTINVAIHEAVHAINEAIIGDTPKWLNEGLAEYFEYTSANMQASIVEPNKSWVSSKKMLYKKVVQPYQLVHGSPHWRRSTYSKMYRSSWVLVHFLASNSTRKQALKKYLHAEQKDKCNILISDDIWSYLFSPKSDPASTVVQDFLNFTEREIPTHYY